MGDRSEQPNLTAYLTMVTTDMRKRTYREVPRLRYVMARTVIRNPASVANCPVEISGDKEVAASSVGT